MATTDLSGVKCDVQVQVQLTTSTVDKGKYSPPSYGVTWADITFDHQPFARSPTCQRIVLDAAPSLCSKRSFVRILPDAALKVSPL